MRLAVTREVSGDIARCELTHVAREPIDVWRARQQHLAYEKCLESLGCRVVRLPECRDLPDSVFVEDVAIVLDEIAVITRPGAESRRKETGAVAETLAAYRPLWFMEPPATLDGGDVFGVGRTLFVGLSSRSDRAAVAQLSARLEPLGYDVRSLEVAECLHLKSAVTRVADRMLLVNPAWIDRQAFRDFEVVEVDRSEPFGANALRIGEHVVYSEAFPLTLQRLRRRGLTVTTVDVSELAKAECGVTCCSLVFEP
jgi:dimethylargininase